MTCIQVAWTTHRWTSAEQLEKAPNFLVSSNTVYLSCRAAHPSTNFYRGTLEIFLIICFNLWYRNWTVSECKTLQQIMRTAWIDDQGLSTHHYHFVQRPLSSIPWTLYPPVIWLKVQEHPHQHHWLLQQFVPWACQITQHSAASRSSPWLVKHLTHYDSILLHIHFTKLHQALYGTLHSLELHI